MTDFFAQLEARHRGEAGVLRPRVPFRFEPVSASLAAADLTGGPAAESGWRGAHLDWPFRRPGGPGRPDEPWTGPAAGDGGQPAAGPEPARWLAGRSPQACAPFARPGRGGTRRRTRTCPVRRRADGAAPGGTWRVGGGPGRGLARAVAPRQEVAASALEPTTALDRAAAPDWVKVLEPTEWGTLPERQAVARTAGPETGEPGTRRPGTARAAEQVARREWPSGPGGDPDEADVAAGTDAGGSRRRSRSALRPEPPGDPLPAAVRGRARTGPPPAR